VVCGGDGGAGGGGCGGDGTDGGGAGGKICRLDNSILSYVLADCFLIENLFGFLGNTRDHDM